MNCLRCNGLAVSDDSFAVQTGSPSDFHGWRCVNCGMIVDDVINRNRNILISRQKLSRGSQRRRYGSEAA
ncbi:MAG: hypothetical protein A4E19_05310 [Nitrospira sp. SG-bin1]|nr:MAG: hypothetical protein A4E19_05310 [Nitrospira sp. SG-bin1]